MIKVIEEGFFTTIQDSGRMGHRHIGVPVAGAMDAYSAHLANSLLENDSKAALFELTMIGPKLLFEEPTSIAVTGATMPIYLNEKEVMRNTVIPINTGDELSFGNPEEGLRTYLGVKHGVDTEKIMGSRSYYLPVTEERCLRPYMQIPIKPIDDFKPKIHSVQTADNFSEMLLKASPGPEYDLLNSEQLNLLNNQEFHVAKENNRMAYQLEESINGHKRTMLTSATLPGTVQLTPSGKLIILMRDAQTTGGYPRILQLSEQAISMLAQKKQGDPVKFLILD